MDYHDFVGEVQQRLELPGTGEAVRAIRAVLTTLGERIQAGEASNLAGALPMEVDRYLLEAESGQRFGFDEFVSRVAERAELGDDEDGRPEAVYYAQAILALVADLVPGSEFEGSERDSRRTKVTTRSSNSWASMRRSIVRSKGTIDGHRSLNLRAAHHGYQR